MTKDEFLSMISSELENLEQEELILKQKRDYFHRVSYKEFDETCYQLDLIRKKRDALKELLNLPAFARIKAMSDAETEEYRRDKVEMLELKVGEIEARKEQREVKLSQLKAEQEELIEQYNKRKK